MKFKDIKPGDKVLVGQRITEGRYSRNVIVRVNVTKVSATQFTTEDGARYTRQYGSCVGERGCAYRDDDRNWTGSVKETPTDEVTEWRQRSRVLSEALSLFWQADRLDLKSNPASIPHATVSKIEQILPLLKDVIEEINDR